MRVSFLVAVGKTAPRITRSLGRPLGLPYTTTGSECPVFEFGGQQQRHQPVYCWEAKGGDGQDVLLRGQGEAPAGVMAPMGENATADPTVAAAAERA
ncbi:hypothetical protein HPB50_005882 [Hyalomma asiaticum]|uniref:Uncharacterized protein n=1 Tax=Hyalomma asiaticum TaxID=266040 RepID=A0ACB7S5K8_HYAAI|nr:hypothetical protein HPB50_005882 [Hyalomma asiaticum]